MMQPEDYDFLSNLSTIWAIVIGAVLATGGGLLATWIERHVERRLRERNAALFFGEMLSTLGLLLEFAVETHKVGDPFGPITVRMLRSARQEIDIYDRNRESLFSLRDAHLRARVHTLILRLTMPIDNVFDFLQEIAATQAHLKALPADSADRAEIAARIDHLCQDRDTSFDFIVETAAQLKPLIAKLEPIAQQSFSQIAQIARS